MRMQYKEQYKEQYIYSYTVLFTGFLHFTEEKPEIK